VKRNFWEKWYCKKERLGKMVLRKKTFGKKKNVINILEIVSPYQFGANQTNAFNSNSNLQE
jgi:hypothetical protein